MAIYTGVADVNGNFNIQLGTKYVSGQKVIVTSEKNSVVKNIEINAPVGESSVGTFQFGGSLTNFPLNLTSLKLTGLTGKIANYCFQSDLNSLSMLNNIEVLEIGEGVLEVGESSFLYWKALTTLILPNSLVRLGSYSFLNCPVLSSVTIKATTPPRMFAPAFSGNSPNLKIYVPYGSVNAYKAHSEWSSYANIIYPIP